MIYKLMEKRQDIQWIERQHLFEIVQNGLFSNGTMVKETSSTAVVESWKRNEPSRINTVVRNTTGLCYEITKKYIIENDNKILKIYEEMPFVASEVSILKTWNEVSCNGNDYYSISIPRRTLFWHEGEKYMYGFSAIAISKYSKINWRGSTTKYILQWDIAQNQENDNIVLNGNRANRVIATETEVLV